LVAIYRGAFFIYRDGMKLLILLAASVLSFIPLVSRAVDAEHALPATELSAGWIELFDNESLFGWQAGSDANWSVKDGVISVSEGKAGLLCTTSEFGDYILKLEFRAPELTNSGVFLRTPLKPKDPAGDCYELNICPASESPFPTGSFVGRKAATPT